MRHRSPVQAAAFPVGLVFLPVGLTGFIPGITAADDELGRADHEGAKALGLLEVDILHAIVHRPLQGAFPWPQRHRARSATPWVEGSRTLPSWLLPARRSRQRRKAIAIDVAHVAAPRARRGDDPARPGGAAHRRPRRPGMQRA